MLVLDEERMSFSRCSPDWQQEEDLAPITPYDQGVT